MSAFFPTDAFRAQLNQCAAACTNVDVADMDCSEPVLRARALLQNRVTLARAPHCAGSISAHAAALAGEAAEAASLHLLPPQGRGVGSLDGGDKDGVRLVLATIHSRAHVILAERTVREHGHRKQHHQRQLQNTGIATSTTAAAATDDDDDDVDWSRRHTWCRSRVSSTGSPGTMSHSMGCSCETGLRTRAWSALVALQICWQKLYATALKFSQPVGTVFAAEISEMCGA